jgi:ADP-ribosyltransferase exoenzyme
MTDKNKPIEKGRYDWEEDEVEIIEDKDEKQVARWVLKLQQDGVLSSKDFCQDPETGLLCGSEPGAGSESSSGGKEGGKDDFKSSAADAKKEVERTSFTNNAPEKDKRSFSRYFSNAYGMQINKAMRGQVDDSKALAAGKQFAAAYERNAVPLNKNLTTYRGVSGGAFANLKAGDIFVDKGIVSTSADKSWAQQFTKGKTVSAAERAKGGILIEVRIPKGTKVVSGRSDSKEQEMVLRPGSKFRVVSRSEKQMVIELQ